MAFLQELSLTYSFVSCGFISPLSTVVRKHTGNSRNKQVIRYRQLLQCR